MHTSSFHQRSESISFQDDRGKIFREDLRIELLLVSKGEERAVCLRVEKKRMQVGDEGWERGGGLQIGEASSVSEETEDEDLGRRTHNMREDLRELDHPVGKAVQRVRNPRLEVSQSLDALSEVVVVVGEIWNGRRSETRQSDRSPTLSP